MDRQDIPDDRQADSVSPSHPAPPQPTGTPPPTPNADKKLNTEEEIEERMSAFERSTVRLTRISICIAIIVGLAVFAQWWEMHTSGVDTHALAETAKQQARAATKSAQAARDFADTAALINRGIGDAVQKLDTQAKATQKSANAAQRSAKVAEDTLIASNRPWLGIQPQIAGPFTLNEQGEARFILRVDTENIGHSPAIRVISAQGFIQNILMTPNPWQELEKICEQATGRSADSNNRGLTETIFPGKPHRETVNLGLGSRELAKSIADLIPGAKPEPYIHPVVLWCVAYRADFSDIQYRTGYVWELMRKGPDGIVPIERNSTVPMNELVIQQIWPLGVLAD